LKTLKLGGISGVLQSASVCNALNLEINLAGKIAETSIASAAVLQLSAALNNVNWGVSPSHLYLAEDIVDKPIQPMNGMYSIPSAAGLGIEVNEDQLKRFLV
jgi:muconate cycloisomerase